MPITKLFSTHFGASRVSVIKPSPWQEARVGFDYAWLVWDGNNRNTKNQVSVFEKSIRDRLVRVDGKFIAYCLQYKVVERMEKAYPPFAYYYKKPYYRAKIDLKRNEHTGLSQHETLKILSSAGNCDVNYACPMLFHNEVVLQGLMDENRIDWENLQLVPLTDAPDSWPDGTEHHICFDSPNSSPSYLSERINTTSKTVPEWIAHWQQPYTGKEVLNIIDSFRHGVASIFGRIDYRPRKISLPASFVIIEIEQY